MALSFEVIDLTRTLDETTLLWPGTESLTAESTETITQDGTFARIVTLSEHSGTHFDAPSHFARDGQHVADVPADRLVRQLHVIDFVERSSRDRDAALSVADVAAHEAEHGQIADGSLVFLRTDWVTVEGSEMLHFPGFGVDAATILVNDRGVVGLGTDTMGIDPGCAVDFPVHRDVTLPRGVWHVENLTNLRAVPATGAWAVVGVPRIGGASGFPARVLAMVPHA